MFNQPELAQRLRIENERLQVFIDRGWLLPPVPDRLPMFRDVDVARAQLIVELGDSMGVNDEGVDIVLDLLDQLYSLRIVLGDLIDALEVQPTGVARNIGNKALQPRTIVLR